jgi:hypothetical protein
MEGAVVYVHVHAALLSAASAEVSSWRLPLPLRASPTQPALTPNHPRPQRDLLQGACDTAKLYCQGGRPMPAEASARMGAIGPVQLNQCSNIAAGECQRVSSQLFAPHEG